MLNTPWIKLQYGLILYDSILTAYPRKRESHPSLNGVEASQRGKWVGFVHAPTAIKFDVDWFIYLKFEKNKRVFDGMFL